MAVGGVIDVVAVVGSPRPRGNSSVLVDIALGEIGRRGLTCRKIVLGEHDIRPCGGHDSCGDLPRCPLEDDAADLIETAVAARGLLLALPVYCDNVSGQTKVFMDRCCYNYAHEIRLCAEAIG